MTSVDVALMSDGLEQLAVQFASRKAHDPFFKSVLTPLHAETRRWRIGAGFRRAWQPCWTRLRCARAPTTMRPW